MSGEQVTDGRRGHFYMYDDILDDYGSELGAFGIAVYAMLCRRANKNGRSHPSLRRMAEDLGISESQAKRELKKLRGLGLISIQSRRTAEGRQTSSEYTILDKPRPKKTAPKPEVSEDFSSPPEVSETPVGEGSVRTPKDYPQSKDCSSKESNDSLSGEPPKQAPSPEEKKVKTEQPGAFACRELMDRVNAARERGAPIHDPPNISNYGKFFANRLKLNDVEKLLLALDYLVSKASDEVEGEPKAWCGFDTALDAVNAGWRPKRILSAVPDAETERQYEENQRMWAELSAGIA